LFNRLFIDFENHKKRILKLSDGFYYKHSPRYDPNEKELEEAGHYGERMLFGIPMNSKIENIDEDLAKFLLNEKNWENMAEIKARLMNIPKSAEKSIGFLAADDYPQCFHVGSYDTYKRGKKK